MRWLELPIALAPQPFETGCWSGSFVAGPGPAPTILYTRVFGENLAMGRIAMAHGSADSRRWHTAPEDVVIEGPPDGLSVTAFRDPSVSRTSDGWSMVVGAGLSDGRGAVLRYISADLRHWDFAGVVLADDGSGSLAGVETSEVWECPHLFELDGRWVLIFSACTRTGTLHNVVGVVGSFDGAAFRPDRWQRLTVGDIAYAMTAFEDREGRRCVMSWLRESGLGSFGWQDAADADRVRAGAHSVAAVVRIGHNDELVLAPHPAITDLFEASARASAVGGGGSLVSPARISCSLSSHDASANWLELRRSESAVLRISVEDGGLRVRRAGRPDEVLDADGTQSHDVELIVDADIVELFSSAGYFATRLDAEAGEPVDLRWCLSTAPVVQRLDG